MSTFAERIRNATADPTLNGQHDTAQILSRDSNNDNHDSHKRLSSVTHTLKCGDSDNVDGGVLGDSATKHDSKPEYGYVIESVADLLNADIPEVDYVVDGLLAAGNSVLWSAREKTGKGLQFIDIAVNVATGHPVLGRRVKPGPVLYVALEENRRVIRDRFRARLDDTVPAHPIYTITGQPLDVTDEAQVQYLTNAIVRTEARLVVIDTLRESHDLNENNSDEMAPVARTFRLMAERVAACIAVTHHMSRGNKSRGSTAIPGGFPDTIEYYADENDEKLCGLLTGRGRDVVRFAQRIAFDPETMRWSLEEGGRPAATGTEKAILDVLNNRNEWLSASDIADCAGKPRGTVRNTLSAMCKRGYVPLLVEGEGRETRYHGIHKQQSAIAGGAQV